MSRNASGTFNLVAGNPVATNTLIESAWANTTMDDLAAGLTDSLSRSGAGGMLAPLKGVDGTVTLPAFSFTNFPNQGLYAAASGDVRMSVAGVDQMRWRNNSTQLWDAVLGSWVNIMTSETVLALPVYNTVAALKLESLAIGMYATTKGYTSIGDEGGATYVIEAAQSVDGYGSHVLANGNTAILQNTGATGIRQYGAIVGADSTTAVQAMADDVGVIRVNASTSAFECGATTLAADTVIEGVGELLITDNMTVEALLEVTLRKISFTGTHCFVVDGGQTGVEITLDGVHMHRLAGDFRALSVNGAAIRLTVRGCSFTADNISAAGTDGEALFVGINNFNGTVVHISDNNFNGFVSGFSSGADTNTFFSADEASSFIGNTVVDCTGFGSYFYHTARIRIEDNLFQGNALGVWVDAAQTVSHNVFTDTLAVPAILPPDDGTVIDITNATDATAFRSYNGGDGLVCAVILYNNVQSFHNNQVFDNAWDGVVISVNTFKDTTGSISGNDVRGNGRHGYFISPQPRGDSWGGTRRIFNPCIQGGKISNNGGHAVAVDGRYVQQDDVVSYHEVLEVVLQDCVVQENGPVGWYDEDGVQSCVMKVYIVNGKSNATVKGVVVNEVLQGSANITMNGLYVIDDGDGSPDNNSDLCVDSCKFPDLDGLAFRNTTQYGERYVRNTELKDVVTSIAIPTAIGGYMLKSANWDTSGVVS